MFKDSLLRQYPDVNYCSIYKMSIIVLILCNKMSIVVLILGSNSQCL